MTSRRRPACSTRSSTAPASHWFDPGRPSRLGPSPVPASLVGEVAHHLDTYVVADPAAYVFRGAKGSVPRNSNWSAMWRKVTTSVGLEGLHFHDLRHTGNTLAAATGASTKELMARMGHAWPRAALIYQHASRERDDAIAAGLDAMIRARGSTAQNG